MPELSLSNVESLSYERAFNYWGDVFNYNSVDSYTIRSRVKSTEIAGHPIGTGITDHSIDPVWSLLDSVSSTGLNYYGFKIDGVSLGTGKIVSINWEEGTDVLEKKYTLSFEINSTGNLFNITGFNYVDIDTSVLSGDFKYVNNFSENISLSLQESQIQEMRQNLSFGIDDPLTTGEKIALKNRIFSGFAAFRIPSIGIRTLYPSIISGNSNSGYITYFNEVIDSVNSRYSFEKTSSYDNNNKATWDYSHAFQLNGNDAVVTENGAIRSIYFKGLSGYRNLSGARDRWDEIKTGIYSRVTGTFALMSGFSGLFTGQFVNFINFAIDKNVSENPTEGTINYSYSYSNNPQYSTSGFAFSHSRSTSIDQYGYMSLTENGEYKGLSSNQIARFDSALYGYTTRSSWIVPRISGTFLLAQRISDLNCTVTGSFYPTSESVTYREFDGIISYSKTYSDNPYYYPTGSNFVRWENVITDNPPVHLHNKFLVPREDEYVQDSDQSTEGSYINNIKIIGKNGVSIDDYLTESYSKVILPTGSGMSDAFLKNMSYSFDPFNNTFEANFEYYYSKYRESEDVLI